MSEAKKDRAFIVGEMADKQVAVLRQRGEGAPVEAGLVRPMKEGEPITGELVTLKPTSEDARLCDVEVHHDARPKKDHAGPSRVSTDEYRSGWDQIFGAKRPEGPPS
ncbi:MAG: hypothetical protein ACXWUG_25255 [Polyangiales bacterium]